MREGMRCQKHIANIRYSLPSSNSRLEYSKNGTANYTNPTFSNGTNSIYTMNEGHNATGITTSHDEYTINNTTINNSTNADNITVNSIPTSKNTSNDIAIHGVNTTLTNNLNSTSNITNHEGYNSTANSNNTTTNTNNTNNSTNNNNTANSNNTVIVTGNETANTTNKINISGNNNNNTSPTNSTEDLITSSALVDLLKNDTSNVTLIDVRMPWELRVEGKIGKSINIPCKL